MWPRMCRKHLGLPDSEKQQTTFGCRGYCRRGGGGGGGGGMTCNVRPEHNQTSPRNRCQGQTRP